jgi:HAD superfamily hydrolase (TIGR01509 family)
MTIRAVIFDFNGVLVDDEAVHFALFREVLAAEGMELTEQAYHEEYLGYDDRGAFEVALARAGRTFDRTRIDALIARKAARYSEVAESGLRIFPRAAECVRAAAERGLVAICSGALRAEIEFALQRMRVRDQVVAIIAAEDTTRCKPDPEGYVLALGALRSQGLSDLDADECLVIEDSLAGIQAARAAGMAAVAVAHTYTPDELTRAGALAVLPRLEDFLHMPLAT